MAEVLIVVAVAIALVIVVSLLVKTPWQRIPATEFEHWVRSFLLSREDGSSMTIRYHGSPAMVIRFFRFNGTGNSCDVTVEIPRTLATEGRSDLLGDCIAWWKLQPEHTDDPSVLLKTSFRVPDIWDGASGALGAGIARKLFHLLGLTASARFDVRFYGRPSRRVIDRFRRGERLST